MINGFDSEKEFEIREIDKQVQNNIEKAQLINRTSLTGQMYDILASRKFSSPIQSLNQGKFPLDLAYQYGSNFYNNLALDYDSPYSQVMWHETRGLVLHRNTLQKYIHPTVIDIGCGNAVKVGTLLSYMKHRKPIDTYIGLDSGANILTKAEQFIDGLHLNLKNSNFEIHNFSKIERTANGNTTYFFVGGTFCNMTELDQLHFLQQIYDVMKTGDNLILDVHSYQDDIQITYDLDKSLDILQQEYIASEKKRYELHGIDDIEKKNTINYYKRFFPGIDLSMNDLDVGFEIEDNKLIDITTIKKPIAMNGYVIFHAGHQFRNIGPTVDLDFFKQIKEPNVEDTLLYRYDNKFTHDFIYRYLESYGLNQNNSKLVTKVHHKTVSIDLELLQDHTITHQSESVYLKKGSILNVMSSVRKTNDAWIKILSQSPLQILESLVISRGKYLDDTHYEMMRSYVLHKN